MRTDIVVRNTRICWSNNHVAYSGGPGGINHRPTPEENAYSHEQHTAPTAMQTQHEGAARGNTNNYASHNGGHPRMWPWPAGGNTGGNEHRAVNYNSSKSNSGNTTAHGETEVRIRSSINYNASKSNTAMHRRPTTARIRIRVTHRNPRPTTLALEHGQCAEKTYNASHSNTSNAPAHTGGGQQHGQSGMAVKGQGPASSPGPRMESLIVEEMHEKRLERTTEPKRPTREPWAFLRCRQSSMIPAFIYPVWGRSSLRA